MAGFMPPKGGPVPKIGDAGRWAGSTDRLRISGYIGQELTLNWGGLCAARNNPPRKWRSREMVTL